MDEVYLDSLLRLLVDRARQASLHETEEPQPGDLVVEVTKFSLDPDAIGWLKAHGDASYREDNTGPTREVWDIIPLRGLRNEPCKSRGFQRWENAEFRKVASTDALRSALSAFQQPVTR